MIRKQYHGSREKELGRCWKEVTHKESGEFMLQIQPEKNYQLASHIGGAWERQVWSARNMLSPLMKIHRANLDEESLNTLFVEVEGIIKLRPLVVEATIVCKGVPASLPVLRHPPPLTQLAPLSKFFASPPSVPPLFKVFQTVTPSSHTPLLP